MSLQRGDEPFAAVVTLLICSCWLDSASRHTSVLTLCTMTSLLDLPPEVCFRVVVANSPPLSLTVQTLCAAPPSGVPATRRKQQ